MIEVVGIFLRVCLSAGCYYFPQPFQTVAKCNAQGAVEISGKSGAKVACLSVPYMMASGGAPSPTGTNYLTAQ